ncbi:hypothetical protein CDAR_617891 [Caerostris darwini]|uniref:Uncharacterized protein n=1 Tax=Caerostris darwini TaxID=1538125 RepID=A0AAV4RSZ9_9ARAC|nr:hypothetical protein CDAR_617891 [Caerostris darwini]
MTVERQTKQTFHKAHKCGAITSERRTLISSSIMDVSNDKREIPDIENKMLFYFQAVSSYGLLVSESDSVVHVSHVDNAKDIVCVSRWNGEECSLLLGYLVMQRVGVESG